MDAKNPILLVLTCLFIALPIALTTCPTREDIAPCTCREETWGTDIECANMDNEDLAKVASNLRGKTFDSFTIEDSKFGFIPHDTFEGVKIFNLYITRSTLKALTDRGDAFVGLEDHLQRLDIRGCVFKNEWDWSVLKNLKKLKNLGIADGHMKTVGEDLKKISVSSVESLSFFNNNISFVSDHAFDSFKNIIFLSLSYNKIKNVKRTMLPNPALEMRWLYLNYNQIEQFPEDMFTSMPNLKRLDIEYNKILFLNENTFSPVWGQLTYFYASGNELLCDCRMSWILDGRSPYYFDGECASPHKIKGKKLTELTSKDFVCYV